MLLFVIKRSPPNPNEVKLLSPVVIRRDDTVAVFAVRMLVLRVLVPRPTVATFLTRRLFAVRKTSAPNPILPIVLRLERIAPPVTSIFDVWRRFATVRVDVRTEGVDNRFPTDKEVPIVAEERVVNEKV
jgi:hypothetical protein